MAPVCIYCVLSSWILWNTILFSPSVVKYYFGCVAKSACGSLKMTALIVSSLACVPINGACFSWDPNKRNGSSVSYLRTQIVKDIQRTYYFCSLPSAAVPVEVYRDSFTDTIAVILWDPLLNISVLRLSVLTFARCFMIFPGKEIEVQGD